jgi:hypothetical protein
MNAWKNTEVQQKKQNVKDLFSLLDFAYNCNYPLIKGDSYGTR